MNIADARGFLCRSLVVALFGACLLAQVAKAESFPSRPIRLIVPSSPGGALDSTARWISRRMSENLGQPVIVDNRPGAESVLGTRQVKGSPADGYTLLVHSSTLTALPSLRNDLGFDPLKDFTGVAPVLFSPTVMVIPGEAPERTVSEFIAKAKGRKLTYASGGTGSTLHLAAAMFLLPNNLDMIHVPYRGAAAALPDVAAGRVSMMFVSYSAAAPFLASGKLKALGVTSTKRLSALPELPTFDEQGVNVNYSFWVGVLAPAGTPKDIVQRLAEAVRFAAESQDVRDRLRADGSELFVATPEEFNAHMKKELEDTAKLVKALNIPKD